MTGPARHVMGDGDPIAQGEAAGPGPDLDDLADHLVAEDGRGARAGRHDLRDIRATESATADADQKLTGADGRPGPRLHAEPALVAEDDGVQAAAPQPGAPWPKRACAQQRNAIASFRWAGTVTRSANTGNARISIS